mgnify:CR=1 FL=1
MIMAYNEFIADRIRLAFKEEKSEYEEHTKVACLIGPKQSVWALFTFIYAFLSIVSIFGGMFGLVDYQTNGNTFFLNLRIP